MGNHSGVFKFRSRPALILLGGRSRAISEGSLTMPNDRPYKKRFNYDSDEYESDTSFDPVVNSIPSEDVSFASQETVSDVSTVSDEEGGSIGEFYSSGEVDIDDRVDSDSRGEAQGWNTPPTRRNMFQGEDPPQWPEGPQDPPSTSEEHHSPRGQTGQLLCYEILPGVHGIPGEGRELLGKRDRPSGRDGGEKKRLRISDSSREDGSRIKCSGYQGGLPCVLCLEEKEYFGFPVRFTNIQEIHQFFRETVKDNLEERDRQEWLRRCFGWLVEFERGRWNDHDKDL